MTTLVLGDTHIWNHRAFGGPVTSGLNQRCRDILHSIETCVRHHIAHEGVTSVVQLGDFFDQPRPPPAVLDATLRMIKATGVPWHILAGNHDIASYDAPSAVAPLGHVEGVHVYDQPEVVEIDGLSWLMMPYTGPDVVAAFDKVAPLLRRNPQFGAVHYGLVHDASRSDLLSPDQLESILERANATPKLYFGHEHGSRTESRRGVSLGSFTKVSFADKETTAELVLVGGPAHAPWRVHTRWPFLPTFHSLFGRLDLSVPEGKRLLLAGIGKDYRSYTTIAREDEGLARELVDSGILGGYKVVDYAEAPEEVALATQESLPLDVVYDVLARTVEEEILEEVHALVEEDMRLA